MRLAVTGHRTLPPAARPFVETRLRTLLTRYEPARLIGLTCLAAGADHLFARLVLQAGGTLEVVVPSRDYRRHLAPQFRGRYDGLLAVAGVRHELDVDHASPRAYMDAGIVMLERADALIAVWDGEPSRGLGGTGDVVAHARSLGLPVTVLWPSGVRR